MLKVLRDDAVALCEGLGFKTCRKWTKNRMTRKLGELAFIEEIEVDEDVVEDEDERERLNDILDDIKDAEGEVDVVIGEDLRSPKPKPKPEDEPEDEPEPKPKKRRGKRGKKSTEPEPDDEDEDEDEPEDDGDAKPPKGKRPATKRKGKKISRWVAACMAVGTMDGPMTIDALAEKANKTYVDGGGREDIRLVKLAVSNVVNAAVHLGVREKDGKKVNCL